MVLDMVQPSLSFLFIEGFGGHYASNAFNFQDKPDLINTR